MLQNPSEPSKSSCFQYLESSLQHCLEKSLRKLQQQNHCLLWHFNRSSVCDHCYYFQAINQRVFLLCSGKQQLGFFTEAVVTNALVTRWKALNLCNLICWHMFVQKGCHFNNLLVYRWRQVKKQRLGFKRICSDLCVPLLSKHTTAKTWTLFRGERGGRKEGRKRFYLDHFLGLVFPDNCISPPKKVTNYRLAIQMDS